MTALAINDRQIALVKRTVAKDCNAAEFDMFISICQRLRLDPLRRQVHAIVVNKDKPDKRQMAIVVGIGGYRTIADRTGNYRPGQTGVVINPELADKDTNPRGIEFAVATVHKFAHGAWHEFSEKAYWEEFAPIKEIWEDKQPTGRFMLDRRKDQWWKMPRVMLEKCAEAKALRRGWPDDFDGTFAEGEMDRAEVLDLTPSEIATASETEDRLAKIGGPNRILIDWMDGNELQPVPVGQLGDQALSFIEQHADEPSAVMIWQQRNRHGLQEYWARDKDGALAVKAAIEKVQSTLQQEAAE